MLFQQRDHKDHRGTQSCLNGRKRLNIDMQHTIAALVEKFSLLPHPEGGFYKEMYRSDESIAKSALPSRFKGDRNFSTAIYFLLEQGNFSAFHRIQSD